MRFNFFSFILKNDEPLLCRTWRRATGGWSPGAGGGKMGVSCLGSGQRFGDGGGEHA